MVTNWMWGEGKQEARDESQIPGCHKTAKGHLGGRKALSRDDNGKGPGSR